MPHKKSKSQVNLSTGSSLSHRYQCPICDSQNAGNRGHCSEVPGSYNEAVSCGKLLGTARKGEIVNGYECAGDNGSMNTTWVPFELLEKNKKKDVKLSSKEIAAAKAARAADRARKDAQALLEKQTDPALVDGRDAGYRSLIGKSKLNSLQLTNLLTRGITESQIETLLADGRIIPVNGLRAPKSIPGWVPQDGFLITAQSEGRIVGAQFAPDNVGDGGKYTWTNSPSQKSTIANGEYPIVKTGGKKSNTLYVIEGFLKPEVLDCRIRSGKTLVSDPSAAIIGCATANLIGAAPEQIKWAIEASGAKRVVLLADSGSRANSQVCNAYLRLQEAVGNDIQVEVADYGQLWAKGNDPDEIEGVILDAVTIPLSELGVLGAKIEKGKAIAPATDARDIRTLYPAALGKIFKSGTRQKVEVVIKPRGNKNEIIASGGNMWQVLAAISNPKMSNRLIWDIEFRSIAKKNADKEEASSKYQWKYIQSQPATLWRTKDGAIITEAQLSNDETIASLPFITFEDTPYVSNMAIAQMILRLMSENPSSTFALAISADLGMGKTQFAVMVAEMCRYKVGTVPRVKLGEQLAAKLGVLTHLQAAGKVGVDGLVLPVSSLKSQDGYVDSIAFEGGRSLKSLACGSDGILIADEITASVKTLISSGLERKGRGEKLDNLFSMVSSAAHLLLMEANLPAWLLVLLHKARPDLKVAINNYGKATGRKLYDIDSKKEWLAVLSAKLQKGDRVAVFLDSATATRTQITAEAIANMALGLGLDKAAIKLVTAATQTQTDHPDFKSEPEVLPDSIRLLVASPVWQCGVSITPEFVDPWDSVFCLFSGVIDNDAAYQMSGRVRHEAPRYVYAVEGRLNTVRTLEQNREFGEAMTSENMTLLDAIVAENPEMDSAERYQIAASIINQESCFAETEGDRATAYREFYKLEEAESRQFRLSLLEKFRKGGYEITGLEKSEKPTQEYTNDMWTLLGECGDQLVTARYQGILDSPDLNDKRSEEINKGAEHTQEEALSFQKDDLRKFTKGSIKFESVEELETYEKTNRAKGIKRSTSFVTGNMSEDEAIAKEAVRKIKSGNYSSDNRATSEYNKMDTMFTLGLKDRMIEAVNHCNNGGELTDGKGIYQAIETIILENQERFATCFSMDFTNPKYRLRSIKNLFKSFGFEITSSSRKQVGAVKTQAFTVGIPALTQRWIDASSAGEPQP